MLQDQYQKLKYGIVVEENNPFCDNACVSGQCYATPGHGNDPKAQYCWGPGGTGFDYHCQKCKYITVLRTHYNSVL